MVEQNQDEKAQEAAEAKKAQVAAAKKAEAVKITKGGVAVKSKVNMLAKDGTQMVVGEKCVLSEAEHKRLSEDARHQKSPFFEKV
jgi:hypothetical protein